MLDPRTKELVAVGAAVAAACQPCLDHHVAEARKAGVSESEVRQAMAVARLVRQASGENMDAYTTLPLGGEAPPRPTPSACCSGNGSERRSTSRPDAREESSCA